MQLFPNSASGLTANIRQSLSDRGIQADQAQQAAIELLGRWCERWQRNQGRWLGGAPAGVYLWGGVGRGKSLIMDAFHQQMPEAQRRRVHFHAFLEEVQSRLRAATGQPDPLMQVAEQLAEQTRLLCFDEFHVHDIGDAILLGRLLNRLVELKVGLVMTSNYPPEALCPNPLYKERFAPAIRLIEQRFQVLNLDGGVDYRQQLGSTSWGHYHFPWVGGEQWLFERLAFTPAVQREGQTEVNHRLLPWRAREGERLWLNFDALCRQPRSSADFLWLCRQFSQIALSDIPRLEGTPLDVQQRFLNFVDIAYDSGTEVFLVCETDLEALIGDKAPVDFSRTRSRLAQLCLATSAPTLSSRIEISPC